MISLSVLAEEKPVTGRFVVSFTATAAQKAWVVNALEQNVYNDLAGYGKVISVKKAAQAEKQCLRRDYDCLLDIYNKRNVDALMLGTVDESHINYRTYDVRRMVLVNSGSIHIGKGSTLLKLRMGAFNAFKPFIEKGGILDKRLDRSLDKSVFSTSDVGGSAISQSAAANTANKELKQQVLLFLSGFILLPFFLSFIGKPLGHPQWWKIFLRWFFPFVSLSLLLIWYQYVLDFTGKGDVFHSMLQLLGDQQWLVTAIGGVAWAVFVIAIANVVMPHLHGMERITPNNLFALLQSAVLTLIIKLLIFALVYLGFFYGVWHLAKLFAIEDTLIFQLLLPLSGLFLFYWFGLILDVLAMSIDVKLSGGKVNYNNVWSSSVHKYFVNHLKRNGVALDPRLVNKIIFLPGNHKGVICYGGGFSRPRISINKDLIKFTLGGIDEFNPQETAIFSRKVLAPVVSKNSVFQILANFTSGRITKKYFSKRFDSKRAKQLEDMQQHFQSDLPAKGQSHFQRIDNIMEGIVLPRFQGPDAFPPLMSDNFDEMQIVQELLQENAMGAGPYDEDAEIDDASERDKDFLFGAILHKTGMLIRHDDIFSTLYWYFRRKDKPGKPARQFSYPKAYAVVADTYVASNFGLNHLLQFLYYQVTNDSQFLTTKGMASGMLKSQGSILNATKTLTDKDNPKAMESNELSRIIWLSRFCQDPIETKAPAHLRTTRLMKWLLFVSLVYISSLALLDAYHYHPVYNETIEQEQHAIAEAIKSKHDKERQEND